ncbi:MAG: 2-oxo acid dehydrogenase subunit E2 [Burkholderiales bacterium]|nr:MAG: 2-oxo acid dehydrogenase subunit E2 [Burkholderiales bacterium]
MGVHVIKVPDIGEGIAEVELVAWHVKVGDTVVEDEILADVMTDKATVEIPSPVAGKVLALWGEVGATLTVGSDLIRLEVEGQGQAAQAAAAASAHEAPAPARAAPSPAQAAPTQPGAPPPRSEPAPPRAQAGSPQPRTAPPAGRAAPATAAPPVGPSGTEAPERRAAMGRPLASPSVRRRARELDIDLDTVHGSGPKGRIRHEDLEAMRARPSGGPVLGRHVPRQGSESVPVIGLRRRIAQAMQASKRNIPHFSYVEEVDVTELEALRATLNERFAATQPKLTLLPFIARAIANAVLEFPQVNATYDEAAETLTRHRPVHLGIATQTEGGLMVPVLRHAEAMDLWSCASEIARLAEAARRGKAALDELRGSTITITSLGALGGIATTPVINAPEVAIVGINRIVERPVYQRGHPVPRLLMNLSSSFDHRIVDGMVGAQFIQSLRAQLEHSATLFIE